MSWNKPNPNAAKPATKKPNALRGVAAGVVVVAALGVLAYFLFSGDDAPEKAKSDKSPSLIKEATPAPAPKPVPEEKPAAKPEKPKPTPWRNPNLSQRKRDELYEKSLAEQKLPEPSSNRLFRSGLEQVMGWVFTTEPGDLPPPLPQLPDFDYVHLEEILGLKNEVKEGDSEKSAETKKIVDYAKQELKKYIEKGGDPQDFLKYYHDELKTAYHERQLAQEEAMKVFRNEPELVDDYIKKVNESLAERGVKPIVIPERLRRSVEREMVKELEQAQ